jgi:hypothetical protein
MTFALWKSALQKDCEGQGNLSAFQAMGDTALMLFWSRGVEPTVHALLRDGDLTADSQHLA